MNKIHENLHILIVNLDLPCAIWMQYLTIFLALLYIL